MIRLDLPRFHVQSLWRHAYLLNSQTFRIEIDRTLITRVYVWTEMLMRSANQSFTFLSQSFRTFRLPLLIQFQNIHLGKTRTLLLLLSLFLLLLLLLEGQLIKQIIVKSYTEWCHVFILTKRLLFLRHFWPFLKQDWFLEAAGAIYVLARALNQTTITKFN